LNKKKHQKGEEIEKDDIKGEKTEKNDHIGEKNDHEKVEKVVEIEKDGHKEKKPMNNWFKKMKFVEY